MQDHCNFKKNKQTNKQKQKQQTFIAHLHGQSLWSWLAVLLNAWWIQYLWKDTIKISVEEIENSDLFIFNVCILQKHTLMNEKNNFS